MLGQKLGQILEKKPSVPSRGHSFDLKFMKLVRKLIIIISRSNLKLGQVGSNNRLLGQILEKPCVHFRGHSLSPKFMKLCQIVNHHNI